MDNFDIIIVGGGMVGQAFALSMAKRHQSNLSIAIIEPNNPNPEVKENFHTCALNALNRHLLLKNPERHANFYPIPWYQ
jgi:2-polyprenyl-6-methoxyphenol hydroxylase-like FAD-dependent oxidoreductase